jgi:hypothetical protein
MSTDAHLTTDTPTPPPITNGTAPHQPREEARRADLALVHEIAEFEKQFPPPEKGALISEARWFVANASALFEQYRGSFVAIMNDAVVGHGPNALQLQLDVARKYNVHPQSFLVELILPSMFE